MTIQSNNLAPRLTPSIVTGAVGFGFVSFCVFATVAFAERWMYTHLTPTGAYLTWIALFILLGGGVLGSLVAGRWRLPRFYLLFALAFFLYAVGWVGAYFTLHGTLGEWVGSLAGSILMALVFAVGFGVKSLTLKLSAVLFVANSLGYFLGSGINDYCRSRTGMMLWGVVYGLFLGAGIAAVLRMSQTAGANSK